MAYNLISKNQLNPNISDLISGYGSLYFFPVSGNITGSVLSSISSGVISLNNLKGNVLISGNSGIGITTNISNNSILVSYTGVVPTIFNQSLNTGDNVSFNSITLNNASFNNRPQVNGSGVALLNELASTTVYTTGDQTINGIKTFSNTGYFNSNVSIQGSLNVTGSGNFTSGLYYNSIPVVTGNYTISGIVSITKSAFDALGINVNSKTLYFIAG